MTTAAVGLNTRAVFTLSFSAENDLSDKQFHFVELTGAHQVDVCDAITDKPIGILQNKPKAGEMAEVMLIGVGLLVADEALAAGDIVGTSTDGQGAKIESGDTTVMVTGIVLRAAAAGGYAEVFVNCGAQTVL